VVLWPCVNSLPLLAAGKHQWLLERDGGSSLGVRAHTASRRSPHLSRGLFCFVSCMCVSVRGRGFSGGPAGVRPCRCPHSPAHSTRTLSLSFSLSTRPRPRPRPWCKMALTPRAPHPAWFLLTGASRMAFGTRPARPPTRPRGHRWVLAHHHGPTSRAFPCVCVCVCVGHGHSVLRPTPLAGGAFVVLASLCVLVRCWWSSANRSRPWTPPPSASCTVTQVQWRVQSGVSGVVGMGSGNLKERRGGVM
jgi:hypothetical protein